MLTPQDIRQIEEHGLSPEQIERQMERFRTGFPYLNLARAAVAGDGIVRMDASEAERCRVLYRSRRDERRIVKFVPASGAATRMFKSLFGYLETGQAGPEVREVIERINRFAFADELHRLTGGSGSPRRLIEGIVRDGLGYGRLPKALILFHKYPEGSRTALEEHLAEGAMYAVGAGRSVHIHLTVSPEHMPLFERLVERVKPEYEARFGVRYDIGYSQQKPSTDTIAVNPDNMPFREGGRLLFRPAGHGALIENLNEIDADLVFVKTVDNVVPDRLKADTVASKETLGGLLLSLQEQAFEYLRETDGRVAENPDEIAAFVTEKLCRKLPASFRDMTAERKTRYLRDMLDRPIRVCGMVRNEGEPGGGPFWVSEPDGGESLQIVESSQIAPGQKELTARATHFNPVDVACGLKNYLGRRFDLRQWTDPQTGFVSEKSQRGRPLRAMELPGLWNGAMARWNTVFVEVPISTFAPVKIVNDLLRPQHQNEP